MTRSPNITSTTSRGSGEGLIKVHFQTVLLCAVQAGPATVAFCWLGVRIVVVDGLIQKFNGNHSNNCCQSINAWTMMLQTFYSLDPVLNHSYCNALGSVFGETLWFDFSFAALVQEKLLLHPFLKGQRLANTHSYLATPHLDLCGNFQLFSVDDVWRDHACKICLHPKMSSIFIEILLSALSLYTFKEKLGKKSLVGQHYR